MQNYIWITLVIILTIVSLNISKKINYSNYNIIKMFTKIDKSGLFMALGTKIGVGSIIGTASSILIGGPGTILWTIIFTLIFSSLIYAESYLGKKYKDTKTNISGPYFYIRKGLKNKILAFIVTVLLVVTYSHFFLMIQTNTIIEVFHNNLYVIIVIIIFLILTTYLNISETLKALNKVVPLMCAIFILIGSYIIIKNHTMLLDILKIILKDALSYKGLTIGLVISIKRSIFQNELLVGTTSISSGISDEDKKTTAYTQILGVYFISFIICTLTAFLILIYLENTEIQFTSYNELLLNVFNYHLGDFGVFIFITEIILFSITTILSGFYIGNSLINYFTSNKYAKISIKISMFVACAFGLIFKNDFIWLLIDGILFIIIILNGYAIFKLKGEVNDR